MPPISLYLCLRPNFNFALSAALSVLLDVLGRICHLTFPNLDLLLSFRTLLSIFHPDDLPNKRLTTNIQERTNAHHRECNTLDDSHNEEPTVSRNLVPRP